MRVTQTVFHIHKNVGELSAVDDDGLHHMVPLHARLGSYRFSHLGAAPSNFAVPLTLAAVRDQSEWRSCGWPPAVRAAVDSSVFSFLLHTHEEPEAEQAEQAENCNRLFIIHSVCPFRNIRAEMPQLKLPSNSHPANQARRILLKQNRH